VVLHGDVAPQGGGVGHDDPVAHLAVMGHVAVRHEEVAVADASDAAAGGRAPVHGGEFPDGVVIPDEEPGLFPLELQVLGNLPQDRELEDAAAAADAGKIPDNHMGADLGVGSDGDPALDDAVRAHAHLRAQLGRGIHDGGGMDLCLAHASSRPTAAIISPSITRVWLTKALPCIFQNFWPLRRDSTSSRNWSPGKTG